jgi:SAM-dependent methyltransferase
MTTQTLDRQSEYDAWGWFYDQTMGETYAKIQLACLEKFLLPQISSSAKLLDVCCGTGHLSRSLVQKGYQLSGVDSSGQMLQYAEKNTPEADFQLVDVRYAEFPPATFDAAFSMSASLNHMMGLNELELVCRQVHQSLKPGGFLLFDLNHHEQMQKWWMGRVAEGQISRDYAWSIRPTYDAESHRGRFTVTMHRRRSPQRKLADLPKQLLYRFLQLDLRRTNRWRHQLLEKFDRWQPTWEKSQATYDVYGFEIEPVVSLLSQIGFQAVQVYDLVGNSHIDANHSAYFLCRKMED